MPPAGRAPRAAVPSAASAGWSWRNPAVRSVVYQVLAIASVLAIAFYLVSNTLHNLETRQIRTGFDFLDREAGFEIGESAIAYEAADTYARAFVAGLLNTLKVSAIGIVLVTIIGTLIGIARLSRNWLVGRLASIYVETVRNVPLLLQLFFWYSLLTGVLPAGADALSPLPGFYLSKSGLNYPVPVGHPAHPWMWAALALGCVAAAVWWRHVKRRHAETGHLLPAFWPIVGFVVGAPLLAWLIGGAPTAMDMPEWARFRYTGGRTVTPEFLALLLGLVIYTAGFVAETVRAGILAVSHGQTEAALALGLKRGLVLRLVVLPQALRVIVPPITSQYLNLVKNSSLAVAIGYPDLVSVANTTLNQTGQAIEAISIIMMVYLTVSLSISLFMNWYNRHIALVER